MRLMTEIIIYWQKNSLSECNKFKKIVYSLLCLDLGQGFLVDFDCMAIFRGFLAQKVEC